MNEISISELKSRLASGDPFLLVDVREPHEHDEYNLGGVNIPITELPFRTEELKDAGENDIVLYCQSGNRSILAQKLLAAQFKIENTVNLKGGVTAWREV
ncbi:MAG: rhodanese-like domain-containing protein [Saprospiraceae bacterium]|nr:rhodanese-like domain-containing protein [Saprospiraceae bacterium]